MTFALTCAKARPASLSLPTPPLNGPNGLIIVDLGSDGIAISHDGKYVYYCPLASRHLYRVGTDALLDEQKSDQELAGIVEDLGDRGFASDGLETDDKGRVYLSDYEHNAILRRNPDGSYQTI